MSNIQTLHTYIVEKNLSIIKSMASNYIAVPFSKFVCLSGKLNVQPQQRTRSPFYLNRLFIGLNCDAFNFFTFNGLNIYINKKINA